MGKPKKPTMLEKTKARIKGKKKKTKKVAQPKTGPYSKAAMKKRQKSK